MEDFILDMILMLADLFLEAVFQYLFATLADACLRSIKAVFNTSEFPNPTLSLSSTMINFDNHPASTGGRNDFWSRRYDTIAAINQLFEVGGKRAKRKASAAAGFSAAQARLKDARRLLDVAITKAYVGALLAETNVQILGQSAASLRKEAEMAQIGAWVAEVVRHVGDASLEQRIRGEVAKRVWQFIDGMRAGDFKVKPSLGRVTCKFCDYSAVCRYEPYRINRKRG